MENFSNEYQTALNGAINNSVTSLVVDSATGSPDVDFRIRIDDEYMLVTAKAGTTFTVTRGLEGSTAASHSDDAVVTHVLTAGALEDLLDRIDTLEGILGSSFGSGLTPTLIATGTAGGGTTITVTPSAAPAEGDLIVFVVGGHNVIPNAAGPTQGTGEAWDERLRFDTDANEWIAVYTKIANATEPATFQITTNNASATLSAAAVVILRGPSTFMGSVYTDATLSTGPVNGTPNGCLVAVWLSALAAGTLFSISSMDQHLAYRVASSEPAFLIASEPTTHAFIWGPYIASAAGISSTWLGNLVMVWE